MISSFNFYEPPEEREGRPFLVSLVEADVQLEHVRRLEPLHPVGQRIHWGRRFCGTVGARLSCG